MSSDDKNWKPNLVHPPLNNPPGRTYFNWNDEKISKWKSDAIKMQEAHVRDNGNTKYFAYTPDEADAIELRILMTIYGTRTPKDGTNGILSCPHHAYTREEKLHARKVKKSIMKVSKGWDKIFLNVIYISTGAKPNGSDDFLASEEPVFVIAKDAKTADKDLKYVDKDGKIYQNFDDYLNNNSLPRGVMMFPINGTYTSLTADGKVQLALAETPSAASPLQRVTAVTNTVAMVAGMAFAVSGVVTYVAPALYTATAAAAITQTGSLILTGYALAGAAYSTYDKTSRDESIRTEVLLLVSSAFSCYTGRLNQYWKAEMAKYAKEGKKFADIANHITRTQKNLFLAVNLLTCFSSTSALLSSFVDLWKKKERTWLDYYNFCMALFLTTNVLTKPKTIQAVFESEQMQCLYQIRNTLTSDEAKEEMTETMKEHATSDEKADLIKKLNEIKDPTDYFEEKCLERIKNSLGSEEAKEAMAATIAAHSQPGQKIFLIRNLKKLHNPTEFFELIKKTGSTVVCSADGMAINNQIDIHPEAYNGIGKAVYQDRMGQCKEYEKSRFQKRMMDEFGKNVPTDKLKEFEEKLEKIKNLPVNEREEATRKLVENYATNANAQGSTFSSSWNNAMQSVETDVNSEFGKMIKQFKQGTSLGKLEKDFEKIEQDFKAQESKYKKQQQPTAQQTQQYNQDKTDFQEKERQYLQQKTNLQQQQNDFDQMEKLGKMKLHGTITPEDEQRLNQYVDKCSRHRKEYFFQTSANYRDQPNTPQNTEAFKGDITTFTNAQNERLCYRIDVEAVKNTLKTYYGPDFEEKVFNGQKIFADMKTGGYDRLNRVLKEYKENGKDLFTAAEKLANDREFHGKVQSSNDVAAITEAINTKLANPPIKNLSAVDKKAYLGKLASGSGPEYEAFRKEFNEKIDRVNGLSSSVRSQWTSPLSMTYHYWKHQNDFGATALTLDEYFSKYPKNLFTGQNATTTACTQDGVIRNTYAQSFGTRLHVGFTVGPSRTTASHFAKNSPYG